MEYEVEANNLPSQTQFHIQPFLKTAFNKVINNDFNSTSANRFPAANSFAQAVISHRCMLRSDRNN